MNDDGRAAPPGGGRSMSQVLIFYTAVPDQLPATFEERWLCRLAPPYRAKLSRRAAAVRAQSIAGLSMLDAALQALSVERDFTALELLPEGKPHWPQGPHFSISHSGGIAACALASDMSIGLDVERIRPLESRAVARVLTAEELYSAGESSERLMELWTQKEAVAKAAGAGLRLLAQVKIAGRSANLQGIHWWLQPIDLGPGYVAHIATDQQHFDTTVRRASLT